MSALTWLPLDDDPVRDCAFVATAHGDIHLVRLPAPDTAHNAGLVLLLHGDGRGSSWKAWASLPLIHNASVVMVDMPGYGASSGSRRAFRSTHAVATVLDTVLDALTPRAWLVLGGRSVGGRTALEYAAAAPRTVDAVVVVHPVAPPPSVLATITAPVLISWAVDESLGHLYAGHKGARYFLTALTSAAVVKILTWREETIDPSLFYATRFARALGAIARKLTRLHSTRAKRERRPVQPGS